jgi:hypothetical protein
MPPLMSMQRFRCYSYLRISAPVILNMWTTFAASASCAAV